MPKKQINDYFFYKIVCLNSNIDLCYVGSTANWKARNNQHKSNCNNENSQKYNSKIYKTIRENGGWCNFKMIQIGNREQLTKRQAEQIEDEYRVELKANMNSQRCYLTEEQRQKYYEENKEEILKKQQEYREENKDKILEQKQKYREENKDKISEQQQKYYEENKDKIAEQKQKYREENKDKISEQQQKYYEENKEKLNEKFTCECGGKYAHCNKSKHIKTKKHQDHFKD